MSPTTFDELGRRERQRLAVRSALRIAFSTTILIVLYAALPAVSRSGARPIIELLAGLLVFSGMLAWQVKSIIDAEHPEVRAVESLAITVVLLIVVFAFTYLSLAHTDAKNFSQPLDHVGAVYFTVTVISTVGFGDIVARSDLARIIVTLQILLDLGVLVGIVRTVIYAARIGVQRRHGERASGSAEDGS
jgi:voltage-gated potassium channel